MNAIVTTNQPITEESPGTSSPPMQKAKKEDEKNIKVTAQIHAYSTQTTAQINSNTCIVEEIEEKTECGATIKITPSSRRPSANSNIVFPVQELETKPESEPAVISTTQAGRMILSLNNLETHLCKFSMIFDSMLILHVLLHKLSWDLSLVSKRRPIQSGEAHHPSTTTNIRAHSSCSLGSSFRYCFKDHFRL